MPEPAPTLKVLLALKSPPPVKPSPAVTLREEEMTSAPKATWELLKNRFPLSPDRTTVLSLSCSTEKILAI